MKNSINIVILASIMRHVKENGLNTNQRKMMDFAKLVSKMKKKNNQGLRKILILICYLIAKELANKKIYKFKRLTIVKLDIVKSVLII